MMMAQANIFNRPAKPGYIRKDLRKAKSHYLAHQTYLKKRRNHFGNKHNPWWKQRHDAAQNRKDERLRQKELSDLQKLIPLSGYSAKVFDNLLNNKGCSHDQLMAYQKLIQKWLN